MILGLDVSHWNTPNWPTLAAAGHKFAYLKATEGTSFVDPKYWTHKAAAESAGLVTGPYMYFRAAWSGAAQAQHFFDNVGMDWKLPPTVDVENRNNLGFTKEVFAARLLECLQKCEELFGRRPLIYTSKSMWESLVGNVPWSSLYDLWVAHYSTAATAPVLPTGWTVWRVWQFTSTPLDTNRMQEEYWNSLFPAEPPASSVTITLPKETAEALHTALHNMT